MKTRRQAVALLSGITLAVAMSLASAATLWADPAQSAAPSPPSTATVQSAYGHLPLSFEANRGQMDSAVQFLSRGRGHTLFLRPSDAVLALGTGEAKREGRKGEPHQGKPSSSPPPTAYSAVRMKFAGADPHAEVVGLDKLPGIVNYFIGGDPSTWHTNIPTYQKVEYKHVYPGIDLVYYGNQGQLEYDLIVAPGADPSRIRVAFDGAEQIEVDQDGDLVLTVPQSSTEAAGGDAATLRLHKPVVYQRDEHGEKHLLSGTYVLVAAENSPFQPASAVLPPSENPSPAFLTPHVVFQVAAYDTSQPLIIDPVLSWATYLGGSVHDLGNGIAVDTAGNAYVTGETVTTGSGFPGTAGSLIQSVNGGGMDVFITKLNAAGTALVYSTYLGGSGTDFGKGIAVDTAGNAYVTGTTDTPGSGFPGTADSSIQSTLAGSLRDAFVTKLNAAGTALVYSTYLGGSGEDQAQGIAVDTAGNSYVMGTTTSPGSGFPGTADSLIQSTNAGGVDAFVSKLNATGTALVYSTYLGSSEGDSVRGIAVDQAGNAYVTGSAGPGFPGTADSLIQSINGGFSDAFVTKLNAAGTALMYSTYLGGSGGDEGKAIAVDTAGNAYVTGFTNTPGSGFPGTAGSSIQSTYGGGNPEFNCCDAFVTKLNAAGTALVYSTYLGGSGDDRGHGIAVDTAGNAHVTGLTTTLGSGFPGTAGSSIQSTYGGGVYDAFVTKLNAAGTALVYSTYLGGSGLEFGNGIAVDQGGNAYVIGHTQTPGSGFPGTASSLIQSTYGGGGNDAFVAKINDPPTNQIPACSAAQANPAAIWSPDGQFVPIAVTGVTDPDGDSVTINATRVTQDEPVKGKSDKTSPDAVIQAGSASVRAERLNSDNGRVYQISFGADDGKGGSCTGAVKVGVPLSLKKGLAAIDDGQVFDSTGP